MNKRKACPRAVCKDGPRTTASSQPQLSWFVRAVGTTRPDGLDGWEWFSHSSGAWKSKIKVPGILVSSKGPSLACGCWPFAGSLLVVCVHCSGCLFSRRDTSHIVLESSLITSLNLIFKGLISKYGYILRYWELGLYHTHFEGDTIQLKTSPCPSYPVQCGSE